VAHSPSSRTTTTISSTSHRIHHADASVLNVITEEEEEEEQEDELLKSSFLTSSEHDTLTDDATLWELKKHLDAFNFIKEQEALQLYQDTTSKTFSTYNRDERDNKDDARATISFHDEAAATAVSTISSTTRSLEATKDEKEAAAIWKARLLLVVAAALYGTNFSLVKVLGETMPVGVSAALRFGLASFLTLPWLLQPANKLNTHETEKDAADAARGATLAGFEVGMWNSIGYIAQAVGLATTDASKVRETSFLWPTWSFHSQSLISRFILVPRRVPSFAPWRLLWFHFWIS
jgi:hypothetical protein